MYCVELRSVICVCMGQDGTSISGQDGPVSHLAPIISDVVNVFVILFFQFQNGPELQK